MANEWWNQPSNPYAATSVDTARAALAAIPGGHVSNSNLYKKERRWADFYRMGALQSLGGEPGQVGFDPLAQLQAQLGSSSSAGLFSGSTNIRGMIEARNRAMTSALNQRASAMGIQGAYSGLLGQQNRTRDALVEQSMAQYEPMRWQAEQQWLDTRSAALRNLSQTETEMAKTLLMSGRSV